MMVAKSFQFCCSKLVSSILTVASQGYNDSIVTLGEVRNLESQDQQRPGKDEEDEESLLVAPD